MAVTINTAHINGKKTILMALVTITYIALPPK